MPTMKKGKGNRSRGSYAFSHHPLKITHEKVIPAHSIDYSKYG